MGVVASAITDHPFVVGLMYNLSSRGCPEWFRSVTVIVSAAGTDFDSRFSTEGLLLNE